MTKQDFIEYLSYPEKLNGHSLASLEKLVQEYPYFQIGRMLYLKNLYNENNIDYEKNLHLTSAYTPGGKILFNLIRKKTEYKPQVSEVKVTNAETSITCHSLPEIFPKLEPIAILHEMPILVKEAKKDNELQLLEKQMLNEAYRISMTVDIVEEDRTGDKGGKAVDKEQGAARDDSSSISKSYSFGEWMKVMSGVTLESGNEKKVVQRQSKPRGGTVNKFVPEKAVKLASKPRAEFYSAETMAKKSLQDDENFITETLAGIYMKQGNFSKALRSYQILLVKHPEKTHIFAPLLEKIQKLIEGQKSK